MIHPARAACFSLLALLVACSGNVVVDVSGAGGTDTTTTGAGATPTTTTTTGTSTGTTGTTTTGTTTTTTGTGAGSCIGPVDFEILSSKPVWTAMVSCAMQTTGNDPFLQQCIHDQTGLSTGCTACCGGYVQCTIQHCLSPCLNDPNGPACVDCRKQSCDEGFIDCSGVPFVPHP